MSVLSVKEICPGTTQNWIQEGALLVDVREQNEVDEISFDVPKQMHIPLSEFEDRYEEIPTQQNVVLVCLGGVRSLRATNYLIHKGYSPEKVVNMKFGLVRWLEKGYAVKGNPEAITTASSGCCSSGSCC